MFIKENIFLWYCHFLDYVAHQYISQKEKKLQVLEKREIHLFFPPFTRFTLGVKVNLIEIVSFYICCQIFSCYSEKNMRQTKQKFHQYKHFKVHDTFPLKRLGISCRNETSHRTHHHHQPSSSNSRVFHFYTQLFLCFV